MSASECACSVDERIAGEAALGIGLTLLPASARRRT